MVFHDSRASKTKSSSSNVLFPPAELVEIGEETREEDGFDFTDDFLLATLHWY